MKFLKMFLAALLAVLVGSIISCFIWLFIFIGIAASSFEGGVAVRPDSILKIDFAEDIKDSPVANPFQQFDIMTMDVHQSISLYSALCAIDAAKNDDRIVGIYIRPEGGGNVDITSLEELRSALAEFKAESGKFVVAYGESYGQATYYLASVADKVYIQPEGGMEWIGLGFNLSFYKGLMDKLGIGVEVFRPTACKYKSAVEPYILTKMSDANRVQMTELAQSMWSTITEAVAESRGIGVDALNAMADELSITLPEEAAAHGLVDGLLYEDQMDDVFAEYGVKKGFNDKYNYISLGDYASQVHTLQNSKNKIAVLYAEGQIVDGSGSGEEIYGNTLAAQLADLRNDKSVKAVVMRVNSPGGSALASDIVWREMELLKAEKPIIVSMGAYAASGGYYISAPADVIVTDRLTLTGSIGVFGIIPTAGKFLNDKLGITFDGVNTNKYSDMGNMTRPMAPAERAAIMRGVDKVYTTFTGLVAQGRNLPIEKVLDIAGGRVWSGEEAVEIGLADANGGLKAAIAVAADKAAIADDFQITEIVELPEGILGMLSAMNVRIAEQRLRTELGDIYRQYAKMRQVLGRSGVQAYCPYEIYF